MNEAATLPSAALDPQAAAGGLEVRSIAKAYDRRAVLRIDGSAGEILAGAVGALAD